MNEHQYIMGMPWYIWFGIGCLFNQILTRILNAHKFSANGMEGNPKRRLETWAYNFIIVGVYALSVYKQPDLWWLGIAIYAGTTVIAILYRNLLATKSIDNFITYIGKYIKPVAFFAALFTLAMMEKSHGQNILTN